MVILVSGATATHTQYAATGYFGHLKTPRNGNDVARIAASGLSWSCDNDAFSAWDEGRFRSMLARVAALSDRGRLLWVACPDVVADARATLDRFEVWQPTLAILGLPVAIVGQDGAEDLDLPWDAIAGLFVGGTTDWKLSACAAGLIREAKRRRKLVHMGRCQTLRRLRIAYDAGCDSVDGSSLSKWPDRFFPLAMRWLEQIHRRPPRGWRGRLVQRKLFA